MGSLNCPACDGELRPTKWYAVELDICDACHGIWFDFGEMVLVADSDSLENIDRQFVGEYRASSADEMARELASGGQRHCPKDKTPLDRHEWMGESRIVLDYCPQCSGTWMDAGELEGYTQAQKEWKPPEPAEEQLAEIRTFHREMREFRESVPELTQVDRNPEQADLFTRFEHEGGWHIDRFGDFLWRLKMFGEKTLAAGKKEWYDR